MPDEALHLVKVPLRADKLAAIATRRGIRLRILDDGYLVHCLLTELWQERAPSPFVIRGSGRTLDVWGYSAASAAELAEHAQAFGDPSTLTAFDELNGIGSRAMPRFNTGRRVGFLARVCPVARVAKARARLRQGAEVDVFVARCFAADPGTTLSREAVYREWFRERMADTTRTGASLLSVRVASIARTRLVRRTQGGTREAKWLERPDVRLEGEMAVEDGEAFLRFLARGVGRHRAFGFGALIVVPAGTPHPRD